MSLPTAIVITDQNHVFTTSLVLAEKFEKLHYNVLRDIENILKNCPDEHFRALNFEATIRDVPGPKNSVRQEKIYNLTRDGFSMVAMGFTGSKAFLWKIAFINAFNRMEAKLRELGDTEHEALIQGLYGKHLQWRETVEYSRQGLRTGQIATLQGKNPSSVRAMKARIRLAGINIDQQQAA